MSTSTNTDPRDTNTTLAEFDDGGSGPAKAASGSTRRELLPDEVREIIESAPRRQADVVEHVWRQLPAAEPDGTPPDRGRTIGTLAVVTGHTRKAVSKALRKMREAGVVVRGVVSTNRAVIHPLNGHYRVDTVDPVLAAEREERERRELAESVAPVRRVRKPTMDDPFAVDPLGPFASERRRE